MSTKHSFYTKDVILIMIAAFLFMFSMMSINPLIAGYSKSLGASSTFTGIIVGILSIVALLLRPIAGNMTDKISKYRLTTIGGLLLLTSIIGYIFAINPFWLLIARLINGFGYVFCTVCMTTWLTVLVPRQHVGKAMGIYGLMNSLAMAIGPAFSIGLYNTIGYRYTLVFAAAATFLMLVCLQFTSNHANPKLQIQKTRQPLEIIQKQVLPVTGMIALFSLPYFLTQAYIVTYTTQLHLSIAVGAFFMIYAIFLLIIRIILQNQFDFIAFGHWFWISLIATAFYIIMLSTMNNNLTMILAAIGMAVGPILGGIIEDYLPIQDLFPVFIIIIPILLIIYLSNRKTLNKAINMSKIYEVLMQKIQFNLFWV